MNNFKPVLCQGCGTVVWSGISICGFPTLLDTDKLTIEEEIIKRVSGIMTYQIYKTSVSFEARARVLPIILMGKNSNGQKIILASHHCSNYSLFGAIENAPDYWPNETEVKVPATARAEGFPF